MRDNSIKITHCADIHLGKNWVIPTTLQDRLRTYLYPHVASSQLFIIGGDFYDTAMLLDWDSAVISTCICHELCHLAQDNNVAIRVIRGTYLHDRDQLRQFAAIAKSYRNLNFKYITSMEVEKVCGIKILYLPDELPFKTAEDCVAAAKEKLSTHASAFGNTVDFVVGHGMFEHTMPLCAKHCSLVYSECMFSPWVNGYVLMGHIHTASVYKKVLYSGSFDRLAHGEEEAKGFFTLQVPLHDVEKTQYKFRENPEATIFTTLDVDPDLSVEQNLAHIVDKITTILGVEQFGNFRIRSDDAIVRTAICKSLANRFKTSSIRISSVGKTTGKKQELTTELGLSTIDLEIPTQTNVAALLVNYLKVNHKIPNVDDALVTKYINEVLYAATARSLR